MLRSLVLASFLSLPLIGLASPVLAQAAKEGHETESVGAKLDAEKFIAASCAPGTKHEFIMVPMKDGTKLATDVYVPPGDGPFPTMFFRGYYSRANSTRAFPQMKDGGFALVVQDARGVYDSEGKGKTNPQAFDYEVGDCDDALNWIAAQKWSNSRIGMTGASGNGVGPCAAYLTRNPHLIMTSPSISSPSPIYYWAFMNGTRRGLYSWMRYTGLDTNPFPSPTIPTFDMEKWNALVEKAKGNPTVLTNSTGWYDIASEAALDQFEQFGPTGKVFVRIGPGTHGGNLLFTWPKSKDPAGLRRAPSITDLLLDKAKVPEKSQLVYFVMGNFRDPTTPGNFQKTTDVWPVPNTPTAWYLHAGGKLSTDKPTEKDGKDSSQAYDYDPKNPAPSYGGNYTYISGVAADKKTPTGAGPQDQRPLLDRKDVLHFTSDELAEPIEITGKVRATLYVSTDVPDTEFVVKFTDVQPDGYEMILRESAVLGRYAEEFKGKPAAMEKGKIYELNLDLWSTAILLAKGHKLGVIITSSSKDAFQVHPNSFTPVKSIDGAPTAHQQVHFSADHPSHITLPVVPVDEAK